jgi:uncharacterized membrane protein (UPF0127 family)
VSVSRRTRLTIAGAVALIAGIGIAVLAVQFVSGGGGRASSPLRLRERAAVAPFTGFREAQVDFDGRCRRVVVADTSARREQGLRGHVDLGEYAGMLFVFSDDTDVPFTMAGVTAPLDIGWYSADGRRVGGAHMAACPGRDQAHCPIYRSGRRYRLALETPGGSGIAGGLAPCA